MTLSHESKTMPTLRLLVLFVPFVLSQWMPAGQAIAADGLQRIKYNNPGLVVDLGVGLWAWPVPWDVDGDGDHDLIVVCPDKPYNGTYLFENVSGPREKMPVFKAARRLGAGKHYTMPSYIDGGLRVLTAGNEHPDFLKTGIDASVKLPLPANIHKTQVGKTAGLFKVRHNQWRYVDYDGDGAARLDRRGRGLGRLRLGRRLGRERPLDERTVARFDLFCPQQRFDRETQVR